MANAKIVEENSGGGTGGAPVIRLARSARVKSHFSSISQAGPGPGQRPT